MTQPLLLLLQSHLRLPFARKKRDKRKKESISVML